MADYVNPIGKGAGSARIDMGVDYTGVFDLYALGSGKITNVYNSGWPGGTFIDLKLDSGPYAGKYVYYAENIAPTVKVGQQVTAGEKIGHARGSYPYTEIGWASGSGGGTMAAAVGQQNKAGDPGAYSTAYGVSMSNLIGSLGGPVGTITPGGIRGTVGAGYPQGSVFNANPTATLDSATSSTDPTLPGCVPLIWLVYLVIMKLRKTKKY
jgi:hypothetical protein